MIFYSNGVEIIDLKEGKKKDNSPWYLIKFSDSNGTLTGFTYSYVYEKLKKGSLYNLTFDIWFDGRSKSVKFIVEEAEPYVN